MSDLIERLRRAATPIGKGSVGVLPTRALYAEAADEIERMRSERAYIIGFNDGWESAHEQQPGDDSPFVEIAGFDPIDYALHYGGRCRDCADADGVCPSSGMPCDPVAARKAAGHVLKAWEYGIEHGYMDNPFATAIRRIKPSEAEGMGFYDNLTPDQQKRALEYRGDENHGDHEFRKPVQEGE